MEKLVNALVLLLLIEMMIAVGLGISIRDLVGAVTNVSLILRAALANYIFVPVIAILLLYFFQAPPLVAAGFLLIAACPAAPFAPTLTGMAKGDVPVSAGLMVVLAASSVVLAPLLLSVLLPLVAGNTELRIDVTKIVITLFLTQLLPLGAGLVVRFGPAPLADKLQKPANRLTGLLGLIVFALIIALQYRTLLDIRLRGYVGIVLLVVLCLGAGWMLAGKPSGTRKAVVFTTAARNVGVALAIATTSFPQTAAVTAVTVFAIVQILMVALGATVWGRLSPALQAA